MRLVLVTGEFPYPATSGRRHRDAATYEAARSLGEATLVSFPFRDAPDPTEGPGDERVVPLPWPSSRRARAGNRMAAIVHRRHVFQEHLLSRGADRRLRALLDEIEPDVVILSWPLFDRFLDIARTAPRLVVDLPEMRVAGARQRARTARGTADRIRAMLDAYVLDAIERKVARSADVVWLVSPREARVFEERHGVVTDVIPNSIRVTDYARYQGAPREAGAFGFVGAFDWEPNVAAALRLLDGVLPRVRKRRPDARLVLVGRWPPPELRARVDRTPGAELHANVPDVWEILASVGPLVVPLRAGTGTKLKVIEAAAAGVPVISSRVGLADMGLRDGVGALVADTDAESADALERIWTDHRLEADLIRRALSWVTGAHDQAASIAAVRRSILG